MKKDDDTAVATKKDLRELEKALSGRITSQGNEIQRLKTYVDTGFASLLEEITKLRLDMLKEAKETRHHFEVVAEQMKHDFVGATNDAISLCIDRCDRIEQRL